MNSVIEKVASCLVTAGSTFREDQKEAYRNAIEKHLSIRSFLDRDKRTVYEQQGGICPICNKHFEFSEMAGDHIVPWSKGGKSVLENLQMLCTDCNLKKSDS